MLCLIADLKTSVPETGNMLPRIKDYIISGNDSEAEITIDDSKYFYDYWREQGLGADDTAYMDSGFQFYQKLLAFDGMMLHASATVIDGEVYIFAGQCGIGKSTHAELLKKNFEGAQLINDDKPALRLVDGKWMVYGTPWSGKNGINMNVKYPLKGICLLTTKRDRNYIRKAETLNAIAGIFSCSVGRNTKENTKKLLSLINRLMADVPIFEMDSLADDEAAKMAYSVMSTGGKEI